MLLYNLCIHIYRTARRRHWQLWKSDISLDGVTTHVFFCDSLSERVARRWGEVVRRIVSAWSRAPLIMRAEIKVRAPAFDRGTVFEKQDRTLTCTRCYP